MFIGLIPPTGCQAALKMACLTSALSNHWFACTPSQTTIAKQLESINERVKTAAPDGKLGPLATVTLCEIMRQCAPAWCNPDSKKPSAGIVRGEAAEAARQLTKDCTPDNVAFTYSGLTALKMNGDTLASFPDAFKEGMAARADRLHDTGPSAPEAWEGELGLPSVHGYFTGSFDLSEGDATKEFVLESDAPRCRSVQQSRKRTWTDTSFWISYTVPSSTAWRSCISNWANSHIRSRR